MKTCVLSFLSLLLSLTALLSSSQQVLADNGGVIEFGLGTPDSVQPAADAALPVAPLEPLSTDVPESVVAVAVTEPAISFDPTATAPQSLPVAAPLAEPQSDAQADLFTGGSDSLVARTVGHAEGTRTPNGSRTRAYYGHSDPGNNVWNLGSFSYQHGAQSPEEADEKQLRRLERQAATIRQKADAHRLKLSLEEELNAIDLANQAPLAALDTPGYVEWLKQAHERGLTGSEAVLWARTQSYWNPRRNRWEAPGLGNTEDGISHDQHRRQTAIARALGVYQQQLAARRREDESTSDVAARPPESIADQIIFQDLSPSQVTAASGQ